MEERLQSIAALKSRLEALRTLAPGALEALQKHFDVDLTYTSNAIEGNTLTLRETAEVIEHGITVGGKSLRDHLEAADHYQAVLWMREIARLDAAVDVATVRELHRRIVARSQPEIGGNYSTHPRRIAGSRAVFPNATKIPTMMDEFDQWLRATAWSSETIFEAHYRLTAIHPFSDGNGRTARLLMNLLLIKGGYPPISVRMEDRKAYLDALEQASVEEDLRPFMLLMHDRLLQTLTDYVKVLDDAMT